MLIIYRSYGGENKKSRPEYYNKVLCLHSLLRAVESVPDARLIFLNNGPIPDDRLQIMESAGEIVWLDSIGMRGSYRAALRLAWSPPPGEEEEIVWFSEDDYLYRPNALSALNAAAALPADYFALYGSTAGNWVTQDHNTGWTPKGWAEVGPLEAEGVEWWRTVSTTSSFGARRGVLREDREIWLQGMLPHRRSLRDHDTCVVLQGYEPHTWGTVTKELLLRGDGDLKARLKDAAIAPFKGALNVRSHRRTERRRVMIAPRPNLACHIEDGSIAPGYDWEALARDTEDWVASRSEDAVTGGSRG